MTLENEVRRVIPGTEVRRAIRVIPDRRAIPGSEAHEDIKESLEELDQRAKSENEGQKESRGQKARRESPVPPASALPSQSIAIHKRLLSDR